MKFNDYIKDVFSTFRPSAQFAVIKGYTNRYGEVADHSILWRVSYENVVKRSIEIVKTADINALVSEALTKDIIEQAKKELLESWEETLTKGPGNNSRYTNADTYESVLDAEGNVIKGLKLHKDDNILHVTGVFRQAKVVISEGEYPVVKSRPKTIAKNKLKALTPIVKWGQYKLTAGSFDKICIDNIDV